MTACIHCEGFGCRRCSDAQGEQGADLADLEIERARKELDAARACIADALSVILDPATSGEHWSILPSVVENLRDDRDAARAEVERLEAASAAMAEALRVVEAFHGSPTDLKRLERARVENSADLVFVARQALSFPAGRKVLERLEVLRFENEQAKLGAAALADSLAAARAEAEHLRAEIKANANAAQRKIGDLEALRRREALEAADALRRAARAGRDGWGHNPSGPKRPGDCSGCDAVLEAESLAERLEKFTKGEA